MFLCDERKFVFDKAFIFDRLPHVHQNVQITLNKMICIENLEILSLCGILVGA